MHPGSSRWEELGGFLPPAFPVHEATWLPPPSPEQPTTFEPFKRPRLPSFSAPQPGELSRSNIYLGLTEPVGQLAQDDISGILQALENPVLKATLNKLNTAPQPRRLSLSSRSPPKRDYRMPPPVNTQTPSPQTSRQYPETPMTAITPGTATTSEPADPEFTAWQTSIKYGAHAFQALDRY